jgi:hypothetical protein
LLLEAIVFSVMKSVEITKSLPIYMESPASILKKRARLFSEDV